MITQAEQIPSQTILEADLCIVGSGAAAIAIALELAGTKLKIIMLTGGGATESNADRDLYRGTSEPADGHEPLEVNRRRMFGGTTSAWGGRCVPFDAIDFEARDWVPHSGWPLRCDELSAYQARAQRWCEAGADCYDARLQFGSDQAEMIPGFDGERVVSWPLERWSPPTDFGRRYRKQLAAAANIEVIMGAHVTHLELEAHGQSLSHVEARSHAGPFFKVKARHFVLACGGLENARLLLASRNVRPCGVGNEHDLVGRFYQSHLAVTIGCLEAPASGQPLRHDFYKDSEGVYLRRRLWLTPETQRKHRIGNVIAFASRPGETSVQERDPIFSGVYVAKFFAEQLRRRSVKALITETKQQRDVLLYHSKAFGGAMVTRTPELTKLMYRRWFSARRLPTIMSKLKDGQPLHLCFQGEHAPNPHSRVSLGTDVDAFGMPRLIAEPRFTELDVTTIITAHRIVAEQCAQRGTGIFRYDAEELERQLKHMTTHFNSVAHHIGTTRMSTSPTEGVVDSHSRLHSVENLSMAGASVFPTSGHANPTLLLITLAVRLADRLRDRLHS
jgi:choline dehydrogenase-like flavoprotein